MSSYKSKLATLRGALLALGLLAASGAALADSAVTLTATPFPTFALPDGQVVPMWGYVCSAPSGAGVSCTAPNGAAQSTSWQPPLIRVPAGQPLTITLNNTLPVATSIIIDGQVGGGLGTDPRNPAAPRTMQSPTHAPYGTTWPGTYGTPTPGSCTDPVANGAPGDTGTFCPPGQADRVKSFATEVAASTGSAALSFPALRPGTYLIHSGTQPSIQHGMGLYGILVVTDPSVACTTAGTSACAYGTPYDADVPLLLSEIDPAQNIAVAAALADPLFDERATYAGPGRCKAADGVTITAGTFCYPPAVNYSPRYYLINGASFDRTNLAASTLAVGSAAARAGASGNVLLRIVNAGQRLHVPAVVGSDLTLLAEDGNPVVRNVLLGGTRTQSSIPMPAGKTFDATIRPSQTTGGTYDAATLPFYDRQLSLSTNNQRDGGMQAYIAVAGGAAAGTTGSSASSVPLSALNPTYYCVAGTSLTVSPASKGVLAGSVGASGVSAPTAYSGTLTASNISLNADGTFTYTQAATDTTCGGTFTYNVNGATGLSRTATITRCDATIQGAGCMLGAAPTANDFVVVSASSTRYASPPPGVLAHVTNPSGLALKVTAGVVNADGSFVATGPGAGGNCPTGALASQVPAGATCVAVAYTVQDAQNQPSSATAYVAFQSPSNLVVNLIDGPSGKPVVADYRWIIEEDRTFWIDPKCQVNVTPRPVDSNGKTCPPLPVESLGYSFHTANMPVIATGCVGKVSCEIGQKLQGANAACDVGNGGCRTGVSQKTPVLPGTVHLDPNKRYYISILPGDAINPTVSGYGGTAQDCQANGAYDVTSADWKLYDPVAGTSGNCGHEMGGAQLAPGQTSVTVNLQQIPLQTAKISAFVFQDDNPLNGENDAGGGVDVIAPAEAGLGGFELKLFDQAGQLGDATGQITYDEFNEPVSNSLAGYIDPITKRNACPITARTDGLVGMIPTCPKYEDDNVTPSPLAGQAVIANLYPGLYEIQAYPAADRIARGEQWLQTNTLDGGKPHEAFIIPSEPGYFQEFGPGGFHVAIGFANPAIINARKAGYCGSPANTGPCTNALTVEVTNNHMSRTPDQRTYDSETYDHYSFTQCYVSIGPSDAEDFAFQNCEMTTDADGKTHAIATFTGMPAGVFKMTVFDQWNDIMLDGLVGTVEINAGSSAASPQKKTFPVTQWRTNLYTRTYIDDPLAQNPGVSDDSKPGLALVNTNIRYRDGSIGFFNNTDLNGNAGFNEVFPLMNWLVVDTTQTRFKPTWTHVTYDAGGPVDGSAQSASATHTPGWSASDGAAGLANTDVRVPLPTDLRVPGAKYCDNADCLATDTFGVGASTGMLFPSQSFSNSIGWQGLLGQDTFIEFGVKPFLKVGETGALGTPASVAENGGISGQVVFASTRPFDDPQLLLQLSWEPGIPHATVNLYSKSTDINGNEVLKLVDTTKSASFDDWAQGFRTDATGALMAKGSGTPSLAAPNDGYIPNMNCPGQDNTSPFFATLKNSKMWLDTADGAGNKKALAYQSQFKCYDGWSQLNQAQPAPYDGYYKFPSVTAVDPATGKPAKTNCDPTFCITNPDDGSPMLKAGTYVVEVIPPTGYELVKEEDKNILMGDIYVGPATVQFVGFGDIYIMPDQAAVGAAYNALNPNGLNATNDIGAAPRHEGDTGSVEAFWPCVGTLRQVPDLNSEFPGAGQASPFAGAMRRLCDRKEVKLADESSTLAKFYLFSGPHIAGHFSGTITNDFASEFDPFSPQFGEKFGPPNLPVGLRDFNGTEVARVYGDQWGLYNGLYFSTWSPNPPNPTGYAPQMSISCMNDPGPINTGTAAAPVWATDPSYNPAYSNFCYEQPFMPGETTYMDTPVIPTQAFADNYNLPDTEYPNKTPAILKVVNSTAGQPQGPWVHAAIAAAPAQRASASFSVSGVARCSNATCTGGFGQAQTTITFPNATVTCQSTTSVTGPNCSSTSGTTRNGAVAAYIRANVVALMGTGYTASGTNAAVTITAPPPTAGQSYGFYNGTLVVSAVTNLGFPPFITGSPGAGLALAGGADAVAASPAAMGITITALGDKAVQNPHYAGPNATAAPFNTKTLIRSYGFGTRPGSTDPTYSGYVAALVSPDGSVTTPLTITGWTDTTISATVPTLGSAFNCRIQQRNAPTAQCGQLVITRGDNGRHSFDAITVTIGGSAPWVVTEKGVTAPANKTVRDYGTAMGRMHLVNGATNQSPIQVALDSADPGDLVLVTAGTYRENLIMWKPVRLQGVGAAAVTINGDSHPAGHMDQWRRQVDCVFGLTLDGVPNIGNDQGVYDAQGTYSCPDEMFLTGDRIPFEAITGWQATGNGNLAQVLQEPTLMGAYEGAGITAVGRGVRAPTGDPFFLGNDPAAAGAFPDGSVYLSNGTGFGSNSDDCVVHTGDVARAGGNYGTSNYKCNPSRIDGLSVLNSSQGGGGVFLHGWTHYIDVSNDRISANHGTLAGAVNVGNGETPGIYVNDGATCGAGVATLCPPIPFATPTNGTIPFAFSTNVRVHHNMLWNNASIGDALFTGTPAGAGGVTVSAGGDNYQIDHNWIAGNLSTGDGAGVQTLGVSFNGKISNNVILFNQSTNPTLPTNGGGIVIQGANEPRMLNGTECGGATDQDCPPGIGDGVGDGLVIDSNLIYGNSAESGTGGGIALEMVNGSDVTTFPTSSGNWYGVTLTNNIIANNVAGYDGAGVSLRDALKVTLINNTIASNDTTASAGVLFKTLGAINASSPPPGCNAVTDPTQPQDPSCLGRDAPHGPQPSGLVTMAHTQNLNDAINGVVGNVTCPNGYGYTGGTNPGGRTNGDCRKFSRPAMVNNMFWQNRVFSVDLVGTTGTGTQSQQNLIALTPALNQTATGMCASGARYWDIGLRTDDVQAGLISAAANKLAITNSILTGAGDIGTAQETIASATNRMPGASPVNAQICNGARTPPESCDQLANGLGQSCHGFNAPPGASETTSTSVLFTFNNIQPTATVDEGHNWLNLSYGPLTLARPPVSGLTEVPTAGELMVAAQATGTSSGAYSIPVGSGAVGAGTTSGAPTVDIYGNSRSGRNDAGAVQALFTAANNRAIVFPGTVGFGELRYGTAGTAQTLTLQNNGAAINGVTVTVTAPFVRATGGSCPAAATFNLGANQSCTFNVNVNVPASALTTSTVYSGTATIGGPVTFTNSPVQLSATGVPPRNDLAITKNDGRSTLYRGDRTTYTITVTNNGNTTLTGAVVADTRPAALSSWSWNCAGNGGGSCGTLPNAAGRTGPINQTLGSLAPGQGVTFTVNAVVSNTAAAGSVANTATVTLAGGVVDATTGNNTATDTDTIEVGTGVVTFSAASVGTLSGTTPRLLNFGNVGNVTSTVTVSVGTAAVRFGTAAFGANTNNRYSIGTDNCSLQNVPAGGSCTIDINFNGTGGGNNPPTRTGSLVLIDNGGNSPQTLSLTGR